MSEEKTHLTLILISFGHFPFEVCLKCVIYFQSKFITLHPFLQISTFFRSLGQNLTDVIKSIVKLKDSYLNNSSKYSIETLVIGSMFENVCAFMTRKS